MSTNLGGARVAKGSSDSDELLSDVSGILLLLMSAKFSLETHAAESTYIDSLRRCICGIQKQFNLTEHDLNEGIVWREASIDGTLRLLEYVQGEVRERLNDLQTAEELQLCIDRLASSRKLSRAPCEIVRPLASGKGPLMLSKAGQRRH